MAGPARYTVKFVAGEHQGSLLVVLSPSQPCSALCDAVRKRRKDLTLDGVEATIHLEEAAGPELYAEDALSDVLPGAKEAVVVVFKVSTRRCTTSWQPALLFRCTKDSRAGDKNLGVVHVQTNFY